MFCATFKVDARRPWIPTDTFFQITDPKLPQWGRRGQRKDYGTVKSERNCFKILDKYVCNNNFLGYCTCITSYLDLQVKIAIDQQMKGKSIYFTLYPCEMHFCTQTDSF